MIADVGLVGMPSVGKSTILSMISNANPKIADYHFTTLSPNLGVVKTKDNTFVVADLPGLIEGASEGVGLGHKFLKHVERTKIIAHVIDMAGTEGREPYEDYVAIRKELEDFSPKLLTKKEIIIANKMDGEEAKENLKKFKEKIRNEDIYEVTALINEGLDKVIDRLSTLVKEIDREVLYTDDVQESHVLYKFKKEKPFTISKDKDVFVVRGDTIEKLFRMTNFNTEEAYERFSNKLRKMGLDEELIKNGLINSDSQYRNEILNPATNKPLTGKIMICYSNANLDIVANYVVPYEQNKIYYKEDKVYVGHKIYKCLATINTKNYSINSLSQFELIYG